MVNILGERAPTTEIASLHAQPTAEPTGSSTSEDQVSPPFKAASYAADGKVHLLLCASGSVATIKLPNICHALSKHSNFSIRLILTPSAAKFLAGQSHEQPPLESLLEIANVDGIYLDEDEWVHPWRRNASILHIELRRWADLMTVAPLSANTMAKMAAGMSDSLLLSVLRAWDTDGMVDGDGTWAKKVIVAPAMNTAMWRHPVTDPQIKVLEEWQWVRVLRPTEKMLACGDTGVGAMKAWDDIVKVVEEEVQIVRRRKR